MIKYKSFSFIFLLFLVFICCSGIKKQKVFEDYYLVCTDYMESDRSLSYEYEQGCFVCVVPPPIIKVIYDENYIIAKKGGNTDTVYYIIPLKAEEKVSSWMEDNKIGPISKCDIADSIRIRRIKTEGMHTVKY